jgi:hypothetical protein
MKINILKEYIEIVLKEETEIIPEDSKSITVKDAKNLLEFLSIPEKDLDEKLNDKSFLKKIGLGAIKVMASGLGAGIVIDSAIEIADIVKDTEKFKSGIKKFKSKFGLKSKDTSLKTLASVYGLPDEVKKLVDDKIEISFLKWLVKEINSMNDNEEINFLEEFQKYTRDINQETKGYSVT